MMPAMIPGQVARVPARLGEKTAGVLARGQHRTLSDDFYLALESFQFVPPFSKRSKCLKFVMGEMQARLGKFLLRVDADKRRVFSTVVVPVIREEETTGGGNFDVSYVFSQECDGYSPRILRVLRITRHASARLLERAGRADLQQALVDELRPAARSLQALAEYRRNGPAEAASDFLLPTATGHFVVVPPGNAVTWVSDTVSAKEARGRVQAARAAGGVIWERRSAPDGSAETEPSAPEQIDERS